MLNYVPRWVAILDYDADMSDTIFKWDHPTTIVTKFGSNWPSSFRGEDL